MTLATKRRRYEATKGEDHPCRRTRQSFPFVASSLRRSVAHHPRGFTLIEMMVAVIVTGVLTGMVVLSFAGPVNRARLVEAVEQVTYMDASARQLARRTGRAIEIRIDLNDGVLERREGSRGVTFHTSMPAAARIEAVRTARGREESGEVTIPVSGLAVSPTYAVKLAGPEGNRWVAVSGLSGEVRTLTDDAQVDSIFAAITASRRDAD